MRNKNKSFILVGIFLIIVVWSIISLSINNSNIFPTFSETFSNMFKLLFGTDLIIHMSYSLLRVIISFIIGSTIGISLGILAGLNKKHEYTLLPIMTFLKAIPTLAFILLFIIYVKFSYIYIVSILIIPIVYQSTSQAIFTNNNRFKNIFMIRNGKTDLYSVIKVLIPASSVDILNSFIQAISIGLKSQVLVESFSSKSNFMGLGKLIFLSFQNSEIVNMLSMVMYIVLFSLIVDILLTLLKNKINKNTSQILI